MDIYSLTMIRRPYDYCCLIDWVGLLLVITSLLVAALEGDGPDDDHVVDGGESSADEGPNPEDPLHAAIAYVLRRE